MLDFWTLPSTDDEPGSPSCLPGGITSAAVTQKGQLVLVLNESVDHHFHHETHFRAYLRLYREGNPPPALPIASSTLPPVLPTVRNARVIKWIVAASHGSPDHFIIYWDDTVVENYRGSGYTAEFKWQPTAEVIEDLYKEDVEEHISWWNPPGRSLSKQLERGLAKEWIGRARGRRALYEEDFVWE